MYFQPITSGYARMGKRQEVKRAGFANLFIPPIWGKLNSDPKPHFWATVLLSFKAVDPQLREDIYATSH